MRKNELQPQTLNADVLLALSTLQRLVGLLYAACRVNLTGKVRIGLMVALLRWAVRIDPPSPKRIWRLSSRQLSLLESQRDFVKIARRFNAG